MQKSERVVQKANADLKNAMNELEISNESIKEITPPQTGQMSSYLASKTLLASARGLIQHNKDWVKFAQNQLIQAKEKLKLDMIEHEKFKHLEFQEIQQEIKKMKIKEAKDLDEVALMTHSHKGQN